MTHMTQFFNFFKVKKKLRYRYVIPFFSNLVKKNTCQVHFITKFLTSNKIKCPYSIYKSCFF